jgi:hypothetical protein
VLIGATLTYRSIRRLGVEGFGGAPVIFGRGAINHVDDAGPIQTVDVTLDEETAEKIAQDRADKFAGIVGIVVIIVGTIIWGYGDLVGRLL